MAIDAISPSFPPIPAPSIFLTTEPIWPNLPNILDTRLRPLAKWSRRRPNGPSTNPPIISCNLITASLNFCCIFNCCCCSLRNWPKVKLGFAFWAAKNSSRCFSVSLTASSPYLLISSCWRSISDISSLVRPNASANERWAKTFIPSYSANVPAWLAISLVKANWSPVNAA